MNHEKTWLLRRAQQSFLWLLGAPNDEQKQKNTSQILNAVKNDAKNKAESAQNPRSFA
jgi:hypothetical protein